MKKHILIFLLLHPAFAAKSVTISIKGRFTCHYRPEADNTITAYHYNRWGWSDIEGTSSKTDANGDFAFDAKIPVHFLDVVPYIQIVHRCADQTVHENDEVCSTIYRKYIPSKYITEDATFQEMPIYNIGTIELRDSLKEDRGIAQRFFELPRNCSAATKEQIIDAWMFKRD